MRSSRDPNRPGGLVEVGPHPDLTGWSRRYVSWDTTGDGRSPKPLDARIAMAFIHFNTLVVRDGIDPLVAHPEFLKIVEYANAVSPEIENGNPHWQ